VMKQWKEKYLLSGIEIYYCHYDVTWKMHSSEKPFSTYQTFIAISDVTDLDNNIALYKREYPGLLRSEMQKMIETYPNDREFKDNYRKFLRKFGGGAK